MFKEIFYCNHIRYQDLNKMDYWSTFAPEALTTAAIRT